MSGKEVHFLQLRKITSKIVGDFNNVKADQIWFEARPGHLKFLDASDRNLIYLTRYFFYSRNSWSSASSIASAMLIELQVE
jgi:hypothetical protein